MSMDRDHPHEAGLGKNAANCAPVPPMGFLSQDFSRRSTGRRARNVARAPLPKPCWRAGEKRCMARRWMR